MAKKSLPAKAPSNVILLPNHDQPPLHKKLRRRCYWRGTINLAERRSEREDKLVDRLVAKAVAASRARDFDRGDPYFLTWLRRQNAAALRCGLRRPLYEDLVSEFSRVTDPSEPTNREVMAAAGIEGELGVIMKTYAANIDKRKPTPLLDPHNLSLPQIDAFLEMAYAALNNALQICGLEGLPNWKTR
jgi:hypothetical protein